MKPTSPNEPDDPIATIDLTPDTEVCGKFGCEFRDHLVAVELQGTDHDHRVLCPDCLIVYLEEKL